jgi:hypothetical protein
MSTEVDMVDPDSVTGHYARFKFSDERAVVLNLSRVCILMTQLDCLLTLSCLGLNRSG